MRSLRALLRSLLTKDGLDRMEKPITRRAFLAGGGAFASMLALGGVAHAAGTGTGELLRPPGAQDASRFTALCLKCNRCESVCPQDCLRTGLLEDGLLSWRTPIMDFHRGGMRLLRQVRRRLPDGGHSRRTR